ncbi:hypothetical protein [Frankia sp. CcWB3]
MRDGKFDDATPFCLFHIDGVTRLATGEIHYNTLLEALPRPFNAAVITMVPYAQLRERGFVCHDGGEPLVSLVAKDCREVDLDGLVAGAEPEFSLGEVMFDLSDDEYADVVRQVVDAEICRGEGANFLLSRRGFTRIEGFNAEVAATVFRRLVRNELGAYLTFCFFDGERYCH